MTRFESEKLFLVDKDHKILDLFRYSEFRAPSHAVPKIIRARVPVRLSFAGGGTDMSKFMNIQNTAVISSTINKYCTASVLPRKDNKIILISKDLGISQELNSFEEVKLDGHLDLLKAAIRVMEPDFGFELETFAEFEKGTGLGGSSALTVAIIGALNRFRNERIKK